MPARIEFKRSPRIALCSGKLAIDDLQLIVIWRPVRRSQRQPLKRPHHRVYLPDFACRERAHGESSRSIRSHKSFPPQVQQRFSKRRTADSQVRRESRLIDSASRRKLPSKQAFKNLLPHIVSQRTLGTHTAYGLCVRYRFSNSSRVQSVLMSVIRSTARIPSRWSISC